jgi:mRNA interferase HicA
VKRIDLIRHLESHGCLLVREGANRSVYHNPAAQRTGTVPRHREVKNPTAIRFANSLQFLTRFVERIRRVWSVVNREFVQTGGSVNC